MGISGRTKQEEHDAMPALPATEIQEYAQKLLDAHGFHAIAEAAQKARQFEKKGNDEEAQTWRRIEQALILMRGPNES
jgi:hypothetical protein